MAPRGKKTTGNTPDNKKGRKRRREDSKSPVKEPSTSKVKNAPQSLPNKAVTLESPIKSPNDWKYYKTIQLGNGLRVLLISDILCSNHRSVERIRQNRNCIDLEILKFNRDVLGIPLPESRDFTNDSTKREVLDPKHVNNCNCEDQTASVALCVSAGSLDEPPEVLGLAHFCEHMIFCGSNKYPARSQFDLFVTGNGGFTNGQTHCDHTLFNFFVNQSHLKQALDMFASFFIDPLMDMEFMLAERDTVDDEFNAKKGLDDEKRAHILMLAGKKGHPVCQFSWGNKETLRTDGEHAKRLHELLLQFYHQYYGSESMYLTIQASEDLEQLEKLVVKYFGEIPCSTVPKPVRNFELMPFDTNEFRRWYCMVPTHAFDLLYLTWEFPPEALRNYQAKPLAYIQRVLAHEGNGGIAHYLIAKNLISSISCSFGESQHEKTKYSTLFSVSFHLINIEQENLNMIIEAFFCYIKFMVARGPQEWFFDELKRIRAMEFHYLDERNVKDNTSVLVHEMQKRGPTDCIIGDVLMSKWEPALIQEYTKMLVPDKANYMLLSQADSVQKCCTKTEPYFGTEYHVRDIPEKLMQKWKNAKPLGHEFSFFKPNPFLTTNFCLITNAASYFVPEKLDLDCDVEKKDKIKYLDRIEMWHLLDANDAEAEYRLLFMSPIHLPDVRCSSSLSLWAGILGRLLRPRLYGATEAKLSYSVGRCHYGIRTEIQGFSQNLHLIINEILRGIAELYTTVKKKHDLFESEKSVMSQRLKNEFSNHERLEKQLRSRVMLNTCYTSLEMHNALQHVDLESFLKFCQNLLKRMYCIGIATGNVSEQTARNTASAVLKAIKYEPLHEESRPLIQATELPLGETILRVRSLDRNGTCSTISVIYQIGHVSLRSCLIGQVIMETMTEHAFQELRVEKSLGYKVEVGVDVNIASNLAVFIKVTSQSAEFTGSYVVEKIDEFLLDFYKTRIEHMTETEFKKLKEDYGYTIRESKTVFKEIIKQEYVFDRQRAEERVMPRIQLDEFKTWYEQYLIPSCKESKMRKLVIQVVGSGDEEYPVKIVQNWGTKTCTNEPKLTLLVPENPSSHHIQDIVKFHASLPVLPKHKMV